ncbi:hypothetical protein FRC07_001471, partial [Ceratobasidium sp. 392]
MNDEMAEDIYPAVPPTFTQLARQSCQADETPNTSLTIQETLDFLPSLRRMLTDENSPQMEHTVSVLHALASAHVCRYEQGGDLNNIDVAIECHKQVLLCLPAEREGWIGVLNNIGQLHHTRFKATGNLSDLEYAISCTTQIISLTFDGHPNKPAYLNNLGVAYSSQFRSLGEHSDFDMALDCVSRAASLTSDSDPDKP